MGQCVSQVCGTGIIKMLIREYGDDVAKFISIEKAKLYIEDKFKELKDKLTQKIADKKTQILAKLDQKEAELDQLVEKVKRKLDDIIPGGLQSIEKIKDQPIEQTLGYSDFKAKFKELKQAAIAKATQKEQQIWQEADSKKLMAIERLQKQQPRLPLYDDLPEKHQRTVFKQGQKLFAKQIEEKQQEMKNDMSGDLNSDNYLQLLKDVLPAGSVDGLFGRAIEKFKQIADKLQGGGLSDLAGKCF